jgi:hypothetical protein
MVDLSSRLLADLFANLTSIGHGRLQLRLKERAHIRGLFLVDQYYSLCAPSWSIVDESIDQVQLSVPRNVGAIVGQNCCVRGNAGQLREAESEVRNLVTSARMLLTPDRPTHLGVAYSE